MCTYKEYKIKTTIAAINQLADLLEKLEINYALNHAKMSEETKQAALARMGGYWNHLDNLQEDLAFNY